MSSLITPNVRFYFAHKPYALTITNNWAYLLSVTRSELEQMLTDIQMFSDDLLLNQSQFSVLLAQYCPGFEGCDDFVQLLLKVQIKVVHTLLTRMHMHAQN